MADEFLKMLNSGPRKWNTEAVPSLKTVTPDDSTFRVVKNPRGIEDEYGSAQTTTPRITQADEDAGATPRSLAYSSPTTREAFPVGGSKAF